MSDTQPTVVTRYTVTLETGHYEIDPFLGCPSIVVLATDHDALVVEVLPVLRADKKLLSASAKLILKRLPLTDASGLSMMLLEQQIGAIDDLIAKMEATDG